MEQRDAPLLGIGALGGVVGGLLGGGNGVLTVPALDRFTSLTRPQVHGTSTLAATAVCVVGAVVYWLVGGTVDLRVGAGMIVGGMVGGVVGRGGLGHRAARPPDRRPGAHGDEALPRRGRARPRAGSGGRPPHLLGTAWFVVPASLVVGIVVGAWAGAMGLGGGLLAVPALVLLFGVDLHTAAGTSLLVFAPNSLVSGIAHLRQGTASLRIATLVGAASAPGAAAGALLALALDNVVLGVVFGTFALLMAVREVVLFVRRRAAVGP